MGPDYLHGIDQELWKCITDDVIPPSSIGSTRTSLTTQSVAKISEKFEKNEKKCMRELHGALPPMVYNHVCT